MTEKNIAADTLNAITEFSKSPIYKDVVEPAAKETGKTLHTVTRAVNMALAPFKVMIWGWEQIEGFIDEGMRRRLADVPAERIIIPNPSVAGPLIEALRFAGHCEELRELYNNLLAKAMDKETARLAHPSFVEILKALSPDEARIVKLFVKGQNFPVITVESRQREDVDSDAIRTNEMTAGSGKRPTRDWELCHFSLLPYDAGCDHVDLGPSYLDNLCRLGLAVIPDGGIGSVSTTTPDRYPPLENHSVIVSLIEKIRSRPDRDSLIDHQVIRVTTFGKQFALAVAQ